MSTVAPIQIRDAVAGELNLVVDSWLKSYLSGRTVGNFDAMRRAWQEHRQLVLRILQRVAPRVAVSPITAEVLGWCSAERGILHFVYVKHWAREQRIASRLVADALPISCYSHTTKAGESLLDPCWIYDKSAFTLTPEEHRAAQEVFGRPGPSTDAA